ncbi:MAG: nuclease [Deltaproteobacteria bacterium]|nr:nuclease [Deltaproteobacteria bacterium]
MVKAILTLMAALWLSTACQAQPAGAPAEAVVAKVSDGDTVVLEGGQKVRLLGIDAPELEKEGKPAEFLAHKARAELAGLVQGKKVRLEYDKLRHDHYGRVLAYLFLPDGVFVNAELVRQGWVRVYLIPPNLRFKEELVAAQRQGMATGRGIWQRALNQDEKHYLGNRKSLRLHRPGCHLAQKMSQGNRVRFDTLKKAYEEGFSPCRTCKP